MVIRLAEGRNIGCVAEFSNRAGKAHQVEASDVRVGLHSSRYKMGRGCMVVCLDGWMGELRGQELQSGTSPTEIVD
jgi:hypothetical protein